MFQGILTMSWICMKRESLFTYILEEVHPQKPCTWDIWFPLSSQSKSLWIIQSNWRGGWVTFKETCFIGVCKTVWKENFREATQGLFHAFPLMFLNLCLMCYKHLHSYRNQFHWKMKCKTAFVSLKFSFTQRFGSDTFSILSSGSILAEKQRTH